MIVLKKITILGILFVSLLGTAFHFLYPYIPIFIFPKNESIFEHLKLLFYPFLIYGVISLFFVKENKKEYFSNLIAGMMISILFTVVAYYSYSGIIGKNIDVVNIIIFIVAVILGFGTAYFKKIPLGFSNSIIYMLIILILLVVWTYYPPSLAFFRG